MLNMFLSHSPLGLELSFQLGPSGGVLGFLRAPLPFVAVAAVAVCCLAAMVQGNGPAHYDRRGRMCRRGSRFWMYPLVICVIVLASRGLKDHVHGTITVEPERPTVARAEGLEDAVSRLERQLDRAGNQMDRAFDRTGNQIDTQVDRGATHIAQQLERLVAQIERRLGHVKRQISRRHREASHPVELAQATDDPVVVEPSAPALPIVGLIPPDGPAPATPPAVPPASPAPSTPAPTAAPTTVAQSSTPSPTASTVPATAPKPSVKTAAASPAEATASSDEKLPEWTKAEIVDEGSRKLVVVPGGFAGSEKEAEQDALEAARTVVGKAIQQADPKVGEWLPSAESVREDAVRHTFVEKIHRKTVSTGTPFIVYRAYHQVELSPLVFNQLVSNWKNEVLPGRLEALGGIVALLTLTFATGAAYFRLDERTHGRYRGRLKLAAVAIISAGVAAVGALAGALV